jgi:hypothetical protein
VPSDASQWQAVIDAAGLTGVVNPPDALWLCQEAAGNLADSVGTFTMAAFGAGLTYQDSVSPWDRRGVTIPDNAGDGWNNTDAGLPDASVGAITLCAYAIRHEQVVPNVNRQLLGIGTAGVATQAYIGGAQATRVKSGAAAAATAPGTQCDVVRPYVLRHDTPGLTTDGFEDENKVAATSSAGVAGKEIVMGSGHVAAPGSTYIYARAWFTAITDRQLRDILSVLGWFIV